MLLFCVRISFIPIFSHHITPRVNCRQFNTLRGKVRYSFTVKVLCIKRFKYVQPN